MGSGDAMGSDDAMGSMALGNGIGSPATPRVQEPRRSHGRRRRMAPASPEAPATHTTNSGGATCSTATPWPPMRQPIAAAADMAPVTAKASDAIGSRAPATPWAPPTPQPLAPTTPWDPAMLGARTLSTLPPSANTLSTTHTDSLRSTSGGHNWRVPHLCQPRALRTPFSLDTVRDTGGSLLCQVPDYEGAQP